MDEYDKKSVGRRIRAQRQALGITQEEFSERIGRVPKFCADIERGQAGMSIETLLKICTCIKTTPDFLLYGKPVDEPSNECDLIFSAIDACTEKQRKDALALLKLFLRAIQ